jgi:gas vesicle protein
MPYAFLGALIGFVVGSVAGAMLAPKKGADILENARIKFRRARVEADAAADNAEKAVKESFEEARRG